jgi:hypothetical protein
VRKRWLDVCEVILGQLAEVSAVGSNDEDFPIVTVADRGKSDQIAVGRPFGTDDALLCEGSGRRMAEHGER